MNHGKNILLVGASVRPFIRNAIEIGFNVVAVDFFGDWDSQIWNDQLCKRPNIIRDYSQLIEFDFSNIDLCIPFSSLAERIGIDRLFTNRFPIYQTWNNSENPEGQAKAFDRTKAIGCFADARLVERTPPRSSEAHRWLVKSYSSCGGLGVGYATARYRSPQPDKFYFQRKLSGETLSVTFGSLRLANSTVTYPIGCTAQLTGLSELNAREFQYCGSIGPIPINKWPQVTGFGSAIGNYYRFAGVWGIDFIDTGQRLIPVDINPRLTASAELFDAPIGKTQGDVRNLLDLHLRLVDQTIPPNRFKQLSQELNSTRTGQITEGKAILFNADKPLEIDAERFRAMVSQFDQQFFENAKPGHSTADIPDQPSQADQTIVVPPHYPILTLRTRDVGLQNTRPALLRLADRMYRQLGFK